MAFAYAISSATVQGNKRVKYGTFTNGDADSGGDITTGLNKIDEFEATITSHVGSNQPRATISGGTVTLATENGTDGIWKATGV